MMDEAAGLRAVYNSHSLVYLDESKVCGFCCSPVYRRASAYAGVYRSVREQAWIGVVVSAERHGSVRKIDRE